MNKTMESLEEEAPQKPCNFLNELRHVLITKFNALVSPSPTENIVELLCLDPPIGFNIKSQIVLKSSKNYFGEQICVEILGIGKIEKTEGRKYEIQVSEYNKGILDKDFIILWEEKNSNFAIKKFISSEVIEMKKQIYEIKDFFERTIGLMMRTLINFLNQVIGSSIDGFGPIKELNANLKKRMETLECFKFKFEKDRKDRQKSTKYCNFYSSAYKNLQEMIECRDRNNKDGFEISYRNPNLFEINSEKVDKIVADTVQAFNKRENEKRPAATKETKKQILTAIKMSQKTTMEKKGLIETFKNINVIDANYETIFSVNMQTNNSLEQQQQFEIPPVKKERSILVEKTRFKGSEVPFDNEKEMLLIMKQNFHPSICSFYVEEYSHKSEIMQIYSKKLPEESIKLTKVDENTNISKGIFTVLKFLFEVAEGINFLLSRKIVHRDLKPLNIMLDQGSAKIIDFGSSAPIYGSEHSLTPKLFEALRSTRDYYVKYSTLPDCIKKNYDKEQYNCHSSFDIYSLGVITELLLRPYLLKSLNMPECLIDNIFYFIKKCKDMQPDDRLVPMEASLFLKYLGHSFVTFIKTNENL